MAKTGKTGRSGDNDTVFLFGAPCLHLAGLCLMLCLKSGPLLGLNNLLRHLTLDLQRMQAASSACNNAIA
jgi:hypothetical protein